MLRVVAMILAAFIFVAGVARAEPPYLLEDPRTLGDRHWEFDFFIGSQSSTYSMSFQLPSVNVQYGWRNNFEFRFETGTTLFFRGADQGKFGVREALVGGKWRFFENETKEFLISTAPRAIFKSILSSKDEDLAINDRIWVFPVELGFYRGPWSTVLEVGLESHSLTPGTRLFGVSFGYEMIKDLELGGEFVARAFNDNTGSQNIVNLGSKYKGWKNYSLFGSIGQTTSVYPGNEWSYFTNFGVKYSPP